MPNQRKPGYKQVNIRLTADQFRRLQEVAADLGIDHTALVRRMIEHARFLTVGVMPALMNPDDPRIE